MIAEAKMKELSAKELVFSPIANQVTEEEPVAIPRIEKTSKSLEEDSLHMPPDSPVNNPPKTGDPKPKKRRFGMKERVLKEFNVEEDSLDAEQIGLIDRTLDKSMIVSGSAGSGKSVIAMYKAQQILDGGDDVLLITYTKSLGRYMQQEKDDRLYSHVYHYHGWVNAEKPSADYFIVDEIQDFSAEEVKEFIDATKKCFFFFGDTAQSIYHGMKRTMSIKEISDLTGVPISFLNSNYRLPKPVAKITQGYVAVDANPYAESSYRSKETELPRFVHIPDAKAQVKTIIEVINKKKMKDVGILVPNNGVILTAKRFFEDSGFALEYKYNAQENDRLNESIDMLDFSSRLPKMMTYHSAKGLQFETVFLPFYHGATDSEARKVLYVAMTRTYRFLYVLYSEDRLPPPLQAVPSHLYLTDL